jgi:hypothetical protein
LGVNPLHKNKCKSSYWNLGSPLKYWCVKAFPEQEELLGLQRLFPGIKIVYIVRNGIEVVHSMGKFPSFSSMSFSERCKLWSRRAQAYRYLLQSSVCAVIRHEEFLRDPGRSLQPVWALCGLSASDAPAVYAQSHIVHPLDSEHTTRDSAKKQLQARQSPWESWSTELREEFGRLCGASMALLGYALPD